MAVIYLNKKKFKIFKKKPSTARFSGETKSVKYFTYSTNNPKGLRGAVAKKGNTLRYD